MDKARGPRRARCNSPFLKLGSGPSSTSFPWSSLPPLLTHLSQQRQAKSQHDGRNTVMCTSRRYGRDRGNATHLWGSGDKVAPPHLVHVAHPVPRRYHCALFTDKMRSPSEIKKFFQVYIAEGRVRNEIHFCSLMKHVALATRLYFVCSLLA